MIENWEMFENMKKGDKFFMIKGDHEYENHVGVCTFLSLVDGSVDFDWGDEDWTDSCMREEWDCIKIAPLCPALEIMFNTKGE